MEMDKDIKLDLAIKSLENLRDSIASNHIPDTFKTIRTINYALELLKKQIPIAPIKGEHGECPICGYKADHHYCPNCGQAFDWDL